LNFEVHSTGAPEKKIKMIKQKQMKKQMIKIMIKQKQMKNK